MLHGRGLHDRLASIPQDGGPRVLLLASDPLSVGEVCGMASSMADNVGRYRFVSVDPAHHLEPFDEAALREVLDRAGGHGGTTVLVTVDAPLAAERLVPLIGKEATVEVVLVDPSVMPSRPPRAGLGNETQDTVKGWCDLHYPDESGDVETKAGNLAEEIGELIAELGLDAEAFADRVVKSASRTPAGRRGSRDAIAGEFADSQIALFDLASTEGVDMRETLLRKMARLRTRRPAESAERQVRKAALGL